MALSQNKSPNKYLNQEVAHNFVCAVPLQHAVFSNALFDMYRTNSTVNAYVGLPKKNIPESYVTDTASAVNLNSDNFQRVATTQLEMSAKL